MLNRIISLKKVNSEELTEPVTLQEVKRWLIIDESNTDWDPLLTSLITQVREAVEMRTHRSIVEKEITMLVEMGRECRLPYSPVQDVIEVSVKDSCGFEPLSSSDYTVDGDELCINSWKGTKYQIIYDAGYNDDNPIPDSLKNGILQEIAYRFEHRGDEDKASGISSGAMEYIRPHIIMAWV